MERTVAVFGIGNVGKAVLSALRNGHMMQAIGYDPVIQEYAENLADARSCHAWFVCVPTPMGAYGLDTSLVEDIVRDASRQPHRPLVIVKSTLALGVMRNLCDLYARVVYLPEFLVERRADADKPERIIIGADDEELIDETMDVLLRVPGWAKAPLFLMRGDEAELVKLASNGFLALKVTFANEIYELCAARGLRYDRVREGITADSRIGLAHMMVPGPDGRKGFGGACFPKDLEELARHTHPNGVLKTASAENRKRRPEYYGATEHAARRAVVDDSAVVQ